MSPVLVLGYGNPGRQDDGLGPAVVRELEALDLPGVSLEADYQLAPESAADLAVCDRAILVDAACSGPAPYQVRRLEPACGGGAGAGFTSHALSPEALLALCREAYGRLPEATLVGVRGYRFAPGEGLTRRAEANKSRALEFILQLIGEWKGEPWRQEKREKRF